jgi:L-amino acid N-acyltransferase YncA
MTAADADRVLAVYAEGIASGNATFETQAPDWAAWDAGHLPAVRLVAVDVAAVKGWAALSAVSRREVYRGAAEVSVYVGAAFRGQGIGALLMRALIEAAEANGIWTLQAGIFPENVSSIALLRAHGFREVGRRERIGRMKGIWRDTMLLERRSETIGVD